MHKQIAFLRGFGILVMFGMLCQAILVPTSVGAMAITPAGSNNVDRENTPSVIFSDNFDDGNADGWVVDNPDAWHVVNGEYFVDGLASSSLSTAGDTAWTDYMVDVDFKGNSAVDRIIYARYQDDQHRIELNIRSDGFNDVSLTLAQGSNNVAYTSFPNTNGTWYHVRIALIGNRVGVFINTALIFDYTDTTGTMPTHGKIGFRSWNNSSIYFDNVVVSETQPNLLPGYLYLPLNIKPYPGIFGKVTFQGYPAGGIPLELRFYNGNSWSTAASITTSSDGRYAFTNIPSLGPGQRYYVRYTNMENPGNLWFWQTRVIFTYTQGDSVSIGDFDISNVWLTSPASGSTISFPFTFWWNSSGRLSSDSYEFNIGDLTDYNPFFYTVPPLGNVWSYTLRALPSDFHYGIEYGWFVAVYSTDEGYGESFYYSTVTFQPGGIPPLGIGIKNPFSNIERVRNHRSHEAE